MYKEEIKNKAREIVIKEAIDALTINRNTSTLTRKSYIREIKNFYNLEPLHEFDKVIASFLDDEVINRWEKFYDTIVQTKNADSLKVAYLSGPNPENDLEVLLKYGVLPENVWAFESENKTYDEAVISALNSKFPFLKIINSGIDKFLDYSPIKFDIIYLDFCAPLPSRNKKQKTLSVITKILEEHALNSPGVLITNVSLPTEEQDSKGRDLMSKLVSSYLYPKAFLEDETSPSLLDDGCYAHCIDYKNFLNNVKNNLNIEYGNFITRLLIDHISIIAPYERFMNSEVSKNIFEFNIYPNEIQNEYFEEYIPCEMESFPIHWTLAALSKFINNKNLAFPQDIYNDKEFGEFANLFLQQLSTVGNSQDLLEKLIKILFLLSGQSEFDDCLSERMKNLKKTYKSSKYYQFCDLLLFHQILESVCRQICIPYHVNIEKTKRWQYAAKQTPMYMDMLILDECRYSYDWMPTLSMIESGLINLERQLAYRFSLDGISKHNRWYIPELFFGTAIVDQYTEHFEAKKLYPRQIIK